MIRRTSPSIIPSTGPEVIVIICFSVVEVVLRIIIVVLLVYVVVLFSLLRASF